MDPSPVLRELVARVARAFYDPKFIVIMDILTFHNIIRDDHLREMLGFNHKEVRRACAKLREEKVLRFASRPEPRINPEDRLYHHTYYILDYKLFIDGVKWKLMKMRAQIQSRIKEEAQSKGYLCPQCGRLSDLIEATRHFNHEGMFICEYCQVVLVDNDNSEEASESQRLLDNFTEQTRPLMDLLQKTDDFTLPAYSESLVDKAVEAYSRQFLSGIGVEGGRRRRELNLAQDNGGGGTEVDVVFTDHKDNADQAEAERKRAQNALPVWHRESTVSNMVGSSVPSSTTTTATINGATTDLLEVKKEEPGSGIQGGGGEDIKSSPSLFSPSPSSSPSSSSPSSSKSTPAPGAGSSSHMDYIEWYKRQMESKNSPTPSPDVLGRKRGLDNPSDPLDGKRSRTQSEAGDSPKDTPSSGTLSREDSMVVTPAAMTNVDEHSNYPRIGIQEGEAISVTSGTSSSSSTVTSPPARSSSTSPLSKDISPALPHHHLLHGEGVNDEDEDEEDEFEEV